MRFDCSCLIVNVQTHLLYTICTLVVPKVSTLKPALSPYVEIEHSRPTVGKEGT